MSFKERQLLRSKPNTPIPIPSEGIRPFPVISTDASERSANVLTSPVKVASIATATSSLTSPVKLPPSLQSQSREPEITHVSPNLRKTSHVSSLFLSTTGRSGGRREVYGCGAGRGVAASPSSGETSERAGGDIRLSAKSSRMHSAVFLDEDRAGTLEHAPDSPSQARSVGSDRDLDSLNYTLRSILGAATLRHADELVDDLLSCLRVQSSDEIVLLPQQTRKPNDTMGESGGIIHLDFEDEVRRFTSGPRIGSDDAVNIGNCACDDNAISQFFPGFDLRRYHCHDLFHHCDVCARRPSTFLCLHCFKSVCPSDVAAHYRIDPAKCFLFLNLLDLQQSYDRMLWCERCRRFTWKCLDVYEPLIEHILYTKGTYLADPVRDAHFTGHVLDLQAPECAGDVWTAPNEGRGKGTNLAVVSSSIQGWRSGQEDAECVFIIRIPARFAHRETPPVSVSTATANAGDESSMVWASMACVAIFDGHGGDTVAKLAAVLMEDHLQKAVYRVLKTDRTSTSIDFASLGATDFPLDEVDPGTAITEDQRRNLFFSKVFEDAFMSFDDSIRSSREGRQGEFNCTGCTACIVGVTNDYVVVVNLGDSGAAVLRGTSEGDTVRMNSLTMLTSPHRLTDATESERVQAAGYCIRQGRIEGLLAVPRALGDFDFKQCGGKTQRDQAVTAAPTVTVSEFPFLAEPDGHWALLLGCDGLWDAFSQNFFTKLLPVMNNESGVMDIFPNASAYASIETPPPATQQKMLSKLFPHPTPTPPGGSDSRGGLGLEWAVNASMNLLYASIAPSMDDAADAAGSVDRGIDNVSVAMILPLRHRRHE